MWTSVEGTTGISFFDLFFKRVSMFFSRRKGDFSGGGGQFDLLGHPHGALRASSSFCSSLVESELIADIVVGKSL